MIIIAGIIVLLVLGFLTCDYLVKAYISNILNTTLKWGEKNNKVLSEIIKDTLEKEYDGIIKQTISQKIETEIESLGFSIKRELNNINYRLECYDEYTKNWDNKINENFEKIKNEIKDTIHDTEVRIDTILKMVRKEK